MTITAGVQRQFFGDDLLIVPSPIHRKQVIRLPPTTSTPASITASTRKGSPWTDDEHERFLTGLEMYPRGPWKLIAQVVATRTTRQTMTHAQKYRQRIARHSKQCGASTDTEPSPDLTTERQTPGETSESRRKIQTKGNGTIGMTPSIARKRPRNKRITALAPNAELESVLGHSTDQAPPELVAMEWLLAVHPVDWDSEVKDNACCDNMLLG